MIRNVFLAMTMAGIAKATRERYIQSKDRALKSLIGYTYPEAIPGGHGYVSLAVIIDGSSNIAEISPQIIVDSSAEVILNTIMRSVANDPTRQYYQVVMDEIKRYIVLTYEEMTKTQNLGLLDNYTASRLVAQMLSEDIKATLDYISGVSGDRNAVMFKSESANLPIVGNVLKSNNNFIYEDGINIVVTGVYMNPDRSFAMNYDVMLSDNINRAVKYDTMFTKLTNNNQQNQQVGRGW